jgi:hypothetical protein
VLLAADLTSATAATVLVPLLLVRERGMPAVAPRDLGIMAFQAFTGSFLRRILLILA